MVTFTSAILGGLPVEVTAAVYPAEPDIGIFDQQVEITSIRFVGRRRKRDGKYVMGSELPEHITDRMTHKEWEQLQDEACS